MSEIVSVASASFAANTNRVDIALSGKNVRLISAEGTIFDVPVEYCAPSKHIMDTLHISLEEELPQMDLVTLSAEQLEAIITYMKEFVAEPYAPIPKPLPKEGLNSLLRPFYIDFLNIKIINDGTHDPATFNGTTSSCNRSSVTDLLKAADLLGIKSLKKLLTDKLMDVTRGKNIKEMFQIFNIPDHVPEWSDFERIRTEHSYAFDEKPQDGNDDDDT